MKKILLLMFVSFFAFVQAENYSLKFTGNSNVKISTIKKLSQTDKFTFEAWVSVDEWVANASVFTLGTTDRIALQLGASAGQLLFTVNQTTLTLNSTPVVADGKWHLCSFIYDGTTAEKLQVVFDRLEMFALDATSLPAQTAEFNGYAYLGENFKGRLDDVRIWNIAISKNMIMNRSTISQFHDSYENLIAYWKGDHSTSQMLVDNTRNYHGVRSNVAYEIVNDNDSLKYLPITTYINSAQIAQGKLTSINQLLPYNKIVYGCARLNSTTGGLNWFFPEYSGTLSNAAYGSEYSGTIDPAGAYTTKVSSSNLSTRKTRKGVLRFKGNGAKMDIGAANFNSNNTFNAWIFVKEWTEGSAIFEKKNSSGDEVSLKLGSEDGEFVFTVSQEVNGTRYNEVWVFNTSVNDPSNEAVLSTKMTGDQQYWHFVSFAYNNTQTVPATLAIDAFQQNYNSSASNSATGRRYIPINMAKCKQNGAQMPTHAITGAPQYKITAINDIENSSMLIGRDFDGYMDEIQLWGLVRTNSQRFLDDSYDVGLRIGKPGVYYTITNLKAYFPANNQQTATQDMMCDKIVIEPFAQMMASTTGAKVVLGIFGSSGWQNMMRTESIRNIAADNLAKTIKLENNGFYDFDGIDLDLEWRDNAACDEGYGKLLSRMRSQMSPGSLLSAAAHGTSASIWTQEAIDAVDFFTGQDYGPSRVKFTWDEFVKHFGYYTTRNTPGIPVSKLQMSYPIYGVGAYSGEFDSTPWSAFASLVNDPDLNEIPRPAGSTYYFCGINQTKKRTKFILDHKLCGLMSFDAVCDLPPSDPKSMSRASNQILASNHELIVEISGTEPTVPPVKQLEDDMEERDGKFYVDISPDKYNLKKYNAGDKLDIDAVNGSASADVPEVGYIGIAGGQMSGTTNINTAKKGYTVIDHATHGRVLQIASPSANVAAEEKGGLGGFQNVDYYMPSSWRTGTDEIYINYEVFVENPGNAGNGVETFGNYLYNASGVTIPAGGAKLFVVTNSAGQQQTWMKQTTNTQHLTFTGGSAAPLRFRLGFSGAVLNGTGVYYLRLKFEKTTDTPIYKPIPDDNQFVVPILPTTPTEPDSGVDPDVEVPVNIQNVDQTESTLTVYTTRTGDVIIHNSIGQAINIYSFDGMLQHSGFSNSNEYRTNLNKGSYIIKVGKSSVKVIL